VYVLYCICTHMHKRVRIILYMHTHAQTCTYYIVYAHTCTNVYMYIGAGTLSQFCAGDRATWQLLCDAQGTDYQNKKMFSLGRFCIVHPRALTLRNFCQEMTKAMADFRKGLELDPENKVMYTLCVCVLCVRARAREIHTVFMSMCVQACVSRKCVDLRRGLCCA
jgi:hypothetical protein